MNVVEVLKRALAAVDEAGLPSDLRVVGFERAVALMTTDAGDGQPGSTIKRPQDEGNGAAGGRLAKISSGLGVDPSQIERLFDEHEAALQFVGDLEKFGNTKAAKTQGLATIFLAGRQMGGYDEGPSPDNVLRSELDRHGLLDVGNYSKYMAPLRTLYNVNGSGRNASYKIKYDGRQKAKELANLFLVE